MIDNNFIIMLLSMKDKFEMVRELMKSKNVERTEKLQLQLKILEENVVRLKSVLMLFHKEITMLMEKIVELRQREERSKSLFPEGQLIKDLDQLDGNVDIWSFKLSFLRAMDELGFEKELDKLKFEIEGHQIHAEVSSYELRYTTSKAEHFAQMSNLLVLHTAAIDELSVEDCEGEVVAGPFSKLKQLHDRKLVTIRENQVIDVETIRSQCQITMQERISLTDINRQARRVSLEEKSSSIKRFQNKHNALFMYELSF